MCEFLVTRSSQPSVRSCVCRWPFAPASTTPLSPSSSLSEEVSSLLRRPVAYKELMYTAACLPAHTSEGPTYVVASFSSVGVRRRATSTTGIRAVLAFFSSPAQPVFCVGARMMASGLEASAFSNCSTWARWFVRAADV